MLPQTFATLIGGIIVSSLNASDYEHGLGYRIRKNIGEELNLAKIANFLSRRSFHSKPLPFSNGSDLS